VPALDLALSHRMIGRAAEVFDIANAGPLGQVARDIAGTVVGQQPRSTWHCGPAGWTVIERSSSSFSLLSVVRVFGTTG
jgi:hypothetical protein